MLALLENITSPIILFFVLGFLATLVKSDLEIPAPVSKFFSLYLLVAIGFKGGIELSHQVLNATVIWTLVAAGALACFVPLYTFFILKRRFQLEDAVALAAAYGSVSAVTLITGISFLEREGIAFGGHMIAAMVLMESPAIVIGLLLYACFKKGREKTLSPGRIVKEALSHGAVVALIGSLFIGWISGLKLGNSCKVFFIDIFPGILSLFLLELGILAARQIRSIKSEGLFLFAIATIIPVVNAFIALGLAKLIGLMPGDAFLFMLLAASASYIAVPAAMRTAIPQARTSLYLTAPLAMTFPLNVTLGIPFYYYLVSNFLNQ